MCSDCGPWDDASSIVLWIVMFISLTILCAVREIHLRRRRSHAAQTPSADSGDEENVNIEVVVDLEGGDNFETIIFTQLRSALGHRSNLVDEAREDRKEFVSNLLITKKMIQADSKQQMQPEQQQQRSTLTPICQPVQTRPITLVVENKPGDDIVCHIEDDMICPICLVEYELDDVVCWSHNRRCNHHFHKQCVIQWLSDHSQCPCCRQNFLALSDDEESEVESQSAQNEFEAEQSSLFQIRDALEEDRAYFSRLFNISLDHEVNDDDDDDDNDADVSDDFVMHPGETEEGAVNAASQPSQTNINLLSSNHRRRTPLECFEEDTWSRTSEANLEHEWVTREADSERRARLHASASRINSVATSLQQSRHPYNREQHHPRSGSSNDNDADDPRLVSEATISLDLGDLAAESILRRAESRALQELDDRTISSESIYTHGSLQAAAESDIDGNVSDEGDMGGTAHQVCAVCRNPSRSRGKSRKLCWSGDPFCNHVFHARCLQEWSIDHDTCPLCANDVDDGSLSYGQQTDTENDGMEASVRSCSSSLSLSSSRSPTSPGIGHQKGSQQGQPPEAAADVAADATDAENAKSEDDSDDDRVYEYDDDDNDSSCDSGLMEMSVVDERAAR